MVLMPVDNRAEICTCRAARPYVAQRATSAKESQRPHRPVSSFARRWITSVRASTARGRRSRPLPSVFPRLVARALPSRRRGAAPPRLRHAGKRRAIGRVAAPPASGQMPGGQRPVKGRSSASRAGQQRTARFRGRPGLQRVGAVRGRDRRQRSAPCVPKARRPGRQRLGGPPDPASHRRHHRPKLAALCLAYFRR
jgi:hypothetical protein